MPAHSLARVVAGIQQLSGQALGHGFFIALAAELNQPAQSQGLTTLGADFHGHLVGGTAHAAGLDFQLRHHVVERFLEYIARLLAAAFLNHFKGAVADILRNAAFAIQHQLVNELGYLNRPVDRIRQHFTLGYKSTTGHGVPS